MWGVAAFVTKGDMTVIMHVVSRRNRLVVNGNNNDDANVVWRYAWVAESDRHCEGISEVVVLAIIVKVMLIVGWSGYRFVGRDERFLWVILCYRLVLRVVIQGWNLVVELW